MRTTAMKMTLAEVDAEIAAWRLGCEKQECEAWRDFCRKLGYTEVFNSEDQTNENDSSTL